jgi:hypothetical protein
MGSIRSYGKSNVPAVKKFIYDRRPKVQLNAE